MMPELGQYAAEVLLAYAVSLGLLALLIAWVWLRSTRVRAALDTLESRLRTKHNG